jgi:hypothetical protein
VEALRCSGVPETIVYPGVPQGLSARPTLSVRTRSSRAATATVTLSYLASGFDWQADYVATLDRDGKTLDLFAWVTLANGDETSFVDAATQTVAGRLNREDNRRAQPPAREPLHLNCWPMAKTSDIPLTLPPLPPPPPPPPPPPMAMMAADSIVVTGSRISRKAQQEELGDLKLYRIPEPVTVAANSQKQVAMLEKADVRVETVYRQRFHLQPQGPAGAIRVLTTRNRPKEGLGLPLPAGRIVIFGAGYERPVLIGQGHIEDSAVGEDVEVEIAEAGGVIAEQRRLWQDEDKQIFDWEVVVTNDRPVPVTFEAELADPGTKVTSRTSLSTREGMTLWTAKVPANGTVRLRYRTEPREQAAGKD